MTEEIKAGELIEEITKLVHEHWIETQYAVTPTYEKSFARFLIARIGRTYEDILKKAERELAMLHGLVVCDGFEAYHRAQRAGADSEGAWNCFIKETWQIDTGEALRAIKATLRLEGTDKEEER